jgi:hypothetical protein
MDPQSIIDSFLATRIIADMLAPSGEKKPVDIDLSGEATPGHTSHEPSLRIEFVLAIDMRCGFLSHWLLQNASGQSVDKRPIYNYAHLLYLN